MIRREFLGLVCCGAFFPAVLTAQGGPGAWEVQVHQQRPYLTVEAIQRNYGFAELSGDAERFELTSSGARLQGRVGASSIAVNGLRYELHFPLAAHEGHRLISAFDLSNLLDLLLRPGEHFQARELKTVFLQTDGTAGAKPLAAEVVLSLRDALAQFGLQVRLLAPEQAPRSGPSFPGEPSGANVWLRLKGNPELPAHFARCSLLAPPESPKRKDAPKTVSLGNLSDAESLALATLLQSGLIFGPGSKVQKVTDGAVGQNLVEPFAQSPGAAVLVEWGQEFSQEHLLKSLAAGVVRYQAFLQGLAKQQAQRAQEFPAGAKFRIAAMERREGTSGTSLVLRVRPRPEGGIAEETSVQPLQLEFWFFGVSESGALKLLQAPPMRISASAPDRPAVLADGEMEWVHEVPADIERRWKAGEVGYAVRLLWQGKEQDVKANPEELRNQLRRFTGLYP